MVRMIANYFIKLISYPWLWMTGWVALIDIVLFAGYLNDVKIFKPVVHDINSFFSYFVVWLIGVFMYTVLYSLWVLFDSRGSEGFKGMCYFVNIFVLLSMSVFMIPILERLFS